MKRLRKSTLKLIISEISYQKVVAIDLILHLLPVKFWAVKVEALLLDRSQFGASIVNLCFSRAHLYNGKSLEMTLLWPRISASFELLLFGKVVSSIC